MQLDGAEVVVIGAGVTGLSAAWWLAQSGADVIVLEKGIVGWEASGRNGGQIGHWGDPYLGMMAIWERKMWPELEAMLGYPTEFVQGWMTIANTEQEMAAVERILLHHESLGEQTKMLDPKTIREIIPIASPEVLGGCWFPSGGTANPQRTVQAFAWSLNDNGGRIYQHTTVTGFEIQGGRVTAVETDRGVFGAEFVVCAAGPQTELLTKMVGAFVPVAPVRVEVIVTSQLPPMTRSGVNGNGLYGRQSRRGNLIYGGGGHEWVEIDLAEPDKPSTPFIRNICRRLTELLPGASELPIIRSWGGVLERTPDGEPVIDMLEDPSNFLVATLSARGFGISPASGKAISEWVRHGEPSISLDQISVRRFRDVPLDWREQNGLVVGTGAAQYPASRWIS